MEVKLIKILAIEDNIHDVRLFRDMLSDVGRLEFDWQHEENVANGLTALSREPFDVVLLDLMLPDSSGLETFARVNAEVPELPIVVLTAVDDELQALQAVRRGAQDYLVKGRFDGQLLSRSITHAIERKHVEQIIRASAAERDVLEREVLQISAREQRRISQDLHDSVGQELTGLSYIATSLLKKLTAKSSPEAEDVTLILEGIRRANNEVHNAIQGLAPVAVDQHGLWVALAKLVTGTKELFKIDCRLACDGPVPVENNSVATNLYHIAQEAIQNAVKHAHANQIGVRLHTDNGRLLLKIKDNGMGMPDAPNSNAGMGLHIMRYRARAIGATFAISSAGDNGTSITVTIPSEVGDEH